MKAFKIILKICIIIASVTSLVIFWNIAIYLIDAKIIIFNSKIPYLLDFYYFGVGCMSIAITNYWEKQFKKN